MRREIQSANYPVAYYPRSHRFVALSRIASDTLLQTLESATHLFHYTPLIFHLSHFVASWLGDALIHVRYRTLSFVLILIASS